jgi:hypothetical protein
MPLDATWVDPDNLALAPVDRRLDERRRDDEALHVLRAALSLVEAGWCKGSFAAWGPIPVRLGTSWATRYCAKGAIYRAGAVLQCDTSYAYAVLTHVVVSPEDHREPLQEEDVIISWNDRSTKSIVIAGFHQAIRELEAEQSVRV